MIGPLLERKRQLRQISIVGVPISVCDGVELLDNAFGELTTAWIAHELDRVPLGMIV